MAREDCERLPEAEMEVEGDKEMPDDRVGEKLRRAVPEREKRREEVKELESVAHALGVLVSVALGVSVTVGLVEAVKLELADGQGEVLSVGVAAAVPLGE